MAKNFVRRPRMISRLRGLGFPDTTSEVVFELDAA